LREYQAGADFADALIVAVNRRLGCDGTGTFDRRAGRRAGLRCPVGVAWQSALRH
jgi:predicted nucleic-acid-binding protein